MEKAEGHHTCRAAQEKPPRPCCPRAACRTWYQDTDAIELMHVNRNRNLRRSFRGAQRTRTLVTVTAANGLGQPMRSIEGLHLMAARQRLIDERRGSNPAVPPHSALVK